MLQMVYMLFLLSHFYSLALIFLFPFIITGQFVGNEKEHSIPQTDFFYGIYFYQDELIKVTEK